MVVVIAVVTFPVSIHIFVIASWRGRVILLHLQVSLVVMIIMRSRTWLVLDFLLLLLLLRRIVWSRLHIWLRVLLEIARIVLGRFVLNGFIWDSPLRGLAIVRNGSMLVSISLWVISEELKLNLNVSSLFLLIPQIDRLSHFFSLQECRSYRAVANPDEVIISSFIVFPHLNV